MTSFLANLEEIFDDCVSYLKNEKQNAVAEVVKITNAQPKDVAELFGGNLRGNFNYFPLECYLETAQLYLARYQYLISDWETLKNEMFREHGGD
jgi:hypothetical protein